MTTRALATCMALSVVIAFTLPAEAQDGALASPENTRIDGSTLIWDPVPDADGYNILFNPANTNIFAAPMYYLDTVKRSTQYEMKNFGTYQVIAFDEDTGRFSASGVSATVRDGRVYYNPDDINLRPETGSYVPVMAVITNTCENVGPGERCMAVCPLINHEATGGACSTSGIVGVDAVASPISYTCTVPQFSGFVTAQVYCMNKAYFQRSNWPDVFNFD